MNFSEAKAATIERYKLEGQLIVADDWLRSIPEVPVKALERSRLEKEIAEIQSEINTAKLIELRFELAEAHGWLGSGLATADEAEDTCGRIVVLEKAIAELEGATSKSKEVFFCERRRI